MSNSKSTAISTIRSEHRALMAVVNNMRGIVAEVRAGRMKMDFVLFWSMIYYIDAFPDQLHHPKEDDGLFRLLKQRTHLGDALIDKLQQQHRSEPAALEAIRRWLGYLEAGVAESLERLEESVTAYADFTLRHVRAEEQDLLPLAEDHLTEDDWREMDLAFGQNGTPLLAAQDAASLNALFHEIVGRTPAPLGLGIRPSA